MHVELTDDGTGEDDAVLARDKLEGPGMWVAGPMQVWPKVEPKEAHSPLVLLDSVVAKPLTFVALPH